MRIGKYTALTQCQRAVYNGHQPCYPPRVSPAYQPTRLRSFSRSQWRLFRKPLVRRERREPRVVALRLGLFLGVLLLRRVLGGVVLDLLNNFKKYTLSVQT